MPGEATSLANKFLADDCRFAVRCMKRWMAFAEGRARRREGVEWSMQCLAHKLDRQDARLILRSWSIHTGQVALAKTRAKHLSRYENAPF